MPFARLAFAGAVAAMFIAPHAGATTRSSFLMVDSISEVTTITSDTARTYTVSIGPNPTFTVGDATHTITDVIGFYLLSDDLDFSPLPALSSFGNFADDSTNSGPGAVAGWRSNPNRGLTPGGSLAFTLPAQFPIDDIDRIGFHVRLAGTFPGTSGNTGNITFGPPPETVPAPGAAALAAVAGGLLARRRR